MKISIWWSGKTKEPYLAIVNEYISRIMRFHKIDVRVFPIKKSMDSMQSKLRESENMLKAIQPSDYIVLLDESGDNPNSRQLSQFLENKILANIKQIVFIIGGPYGFADALYDRCQKKLALSKMTFTHDMVRIIFLEQIYRAFTIKNNLPYHHD